jgi:glycosyltransferase involved in cell wall biosynthesis
MIQAQPTRVLFLNHTSNLGGGEIALFNLLLHLDKSKVEPVVVLGAEGPLSNALAPNFETHVIRLPTRVREAKKDSLGVRSVFRFREIISLLQYILTLRSFIRTHNIQLVHANSLKSDIMGGIAARLCFCPVVWHVRDRIETEYLPLTVVWVFRLLAKVIPRYIVVNSRSTLRSLNLPKSSRGVAVPSRVVVHDGTALPEAPRNTKQVNRYPQVGLVGRISPWKGQHIFVQAAAKVHRYFPEARFIIIGSVLFGEHEYESRVHNLSETLGIADIIEFAGFRRDVAIRIAELDIVVHASTIGEPFGQVIIEGMAAGKPIVATDGGGVPEIVVNGETGLLVPMSDSDAMAEAICRLLANPKLAIRLGQSGRQRVCDHFTIQLTARKIEQVYDTITQGRQR